MNDLFNFQFVNRVDERKYIKEKLESEEYLITIQGKNGIGKTALLNMIKGEVPNYEFIYINRIGGTSENYLSLFIKELNKYSEINIYDYIKKNSITIKN